jgi:catechol 2,3-dioxygenase-like lactoylglutathione lyase family enzyme
MEKRLGTLTLGVRDLARARKFYEEGLGWTRDGGESDIAFYQLNGFVPGLYK